MKNMMLFCISILVWSVTLSFAAEKKLKVDEEQVLEWNLFADKLIDLHKDAISEKEINTKERYGGYKDLPRFYREVSYYDAETGNLLSRVQWETENPKRVHAIEVYRYDQQGRLSRDYLAAYLPFHRNAPVQTTVNLYQYQNGVLAWRQFDASGNRIYEKCHAVKDEENVLVELWDDEIHYTVKDQEYKRCFSGFEKTAGAYLDPR